MGKTRYTPRSTVYNDHISVDGRVLAAVYLYGEDVKFQLNFYQGGLYTENKYESLSCTLDEAVEYMKEAFLIEEE